MEGKGLLLKCPAWRQRITMLLYFLAPPPKNISGCDKKNKLISLIEEMEGKLTRLQ